MKKCIRCGNTAEVETENGYLCNSCDCKRLGCLNNIEIEDTETDFWYEVKLNLRGKNNE